MGKNPYRLSHRIRPLIHAQGIAHGAGCHHTANRRHRPGHVAETGFHAGTGRLLRPPLSKPQMPQGGRKSAFLWQDEPDELHHPVRHRRPHLLPHRAIPRPLLRLHREPAHRHIHLPAAGAVLQMVARQTQARSPGILLAPMDLDRHQ